ncbi:MAG: winged helix-turn-helix transcriptional regulator [Chloroflexi bacterium]|jgi:DNA-binding transcriptional ArsR family regulator|nr:winged helix-turn-helix transcriptional regulator [Chloroflexota bacterium]MBT3670897.1 winged helix-turn-helix transcriptional regulator [Chloroflexota bacterium]MBT4002914.1 winged helix-turn-helix transcriptional regulator [Chloroflexota bacterium]MBT4306389.1 winged helix-turn-helix transcriptional regulator [Chloroflexota bacterium]MBT4532730.1 winged helix-turn-helix transcriptional regulator [Chloroflexota bacterium]
MDLRNEINQLHANICNGLADPNRILILYALAEKPTNVSNLANNLGIPQPTISRHLKVLRERHMVTAERDGKAVIYQLADRRIIEALDLMRNVMSDSLENQANLVNNFNE